MKYAYSTTRLVIKLIIALFFIAEGFSLLLKEEPSVIQKIIGGAILIGGIYYLFVYGYESTRKYCEVTEEKIKLFTLGKGQKIDCSAIRKIVRKGTLYTFYTPTTCIEISLIQMKKSQRSQFIQFYEEQCKILENSHHDDGRKSSRS